MEDNIVISVAHLNKCYLLSGDEDNPHHYNTVREKIAGTARKVFRPSKNNPQAVTKTKETFHALRDVSFTVKRGSRMGIIGRNGAGKSTLLKILSNITQPTSGDVHVKGRVVSLLEVGTGFHPELSGRENIFLNGVILGMKRSEIRKKFDQIVAFAEIEQFLDTPVKKYSSGMYMRLAFAIASHVEPDILILDEMLAVGDAEFQKKCLLKMEEISKMDGRTVLFVSHSIDAIRHFCDAAIFLEKGTIAAKGPIKEVTEAYINSYSKKATEFVPDTTKPIHFAQMELDKNKLVFGEALTIKCCINSDRDVAEYALGIGIFNNLDVRIGSALVFSKKPLATGDNFIQISVPIHTVVPGDYRISTGLAIDDMAEIADVAVDYPTFTVVTGSEHALVFRNWQASFSDNMFNAEIL